ncbi:MAG: hypothetical protein QOG75_4683 [Mycobacterium sp.]|nr:hypothetical protein [Mycobacterium sp.]
MLEVIDKGHCSDAHPTPVLFVHGALHAAWCWDEHFLNFFADNGYRVLALSCLICGLFRDDLQIAECMAKSRLRFARRALRLTLQTQPIRRARDGPGRQRLRNGVLPSQQAPLAAACDTNRRRAGPTPRPQRNSGKMTSDANVAWQLADAASPCLTGDERTVVFVQLGCGDNHLAAERILAVVVREGFPLPAALLTTLTTWLDQYVGTREERRLRALIGRARPHAT